MSFRAQAPREPIQIRYDGEAVTASKGEPLAASLVAAGRLGVARSTKFHRPRGPACMRGACDGCLARVNGEPNVMTCMVAAHEGMTVDSQNTLGSKNVDLLRVTDWFFPQGMNHHELLAGIPGAQGVMQAFARRVAGLGRLPQTELLPRPARRRKADVVVVGCGPSGMTAAAVLAARGRAVEVVDDALRPGGGLRAIRSRGFWTEAEAPFQGLLNKGAIRLRTNSVVGGIFGDDLLIVSPAGAEVVTANDTVLATGAHDGVGLFEGNDLPGVMSARAAGLLFAEGVVVGKRVAVVTEGDGGTFGTAFVEATRGICDIFRVAHVVRARGNSAVRAVVFREGTQDREVRVDALLTDEARSPAYELPLQAGAELVHEARGFVARAPEGRIRDGFWVAGEVGGTPFEPRAILDNAVAVADAILRPRSDHGASGAHSSRSAPNIASPPATATKSNVPSKTR
jgi:sarcosine oxidase, subunit alpha